MRLISSAVLAALAIGADAPAQNAGPARGVGTANLPTNGTARAPLPTDPESVFALAARQIAAADDAVKEAERAVRSADERIQTAADEVAASTTLVAQVAAGVSTVVRTAAAGRPSPAGPKSGTRVVDAFSDAGTWFREEWSDPGSFTSEGGKLHIQFSVETQQKFALTQVFPRGLAVGKTETILIDAERAGSQDVSIALGLFSGVKYFESAPVRLLSGLNRVSFSLSAATFKCEATRWNYSASLPDRLVLDKLTLLVYARRAGKIAVDNLRIATP
jgi:hypothetical protein